LAAVLVALASLLLAPQVRAALAEFLQIGGVRITLPQPDPQGKMRDDIYPSHFKQRPPGEFGTQGPLSALVGETTILEARQQAGFEITLPMYPAGLGEPDRVFLQNIERREFVILVWEDGKGDVDLALYILGPNVRLTKGEPETVEVVEVNGQPAVWVTGNHILFFSDGCCEGILVQAPALVWQVGELTYRLESHLPLDEVVRIAESIKQR
jgi:hypothetical protein